MQITIPLGVYEVRWENRDMVEGEYVCQDPLMAHASLVVGQLSREVTYPATGANGEPAGSILSLIDTATPQQNELQAPLSRTWKELGARVTVPAGCSATVEYFSADAPSGPYTARQTNPTLVPQKRYAFFDVKFFSTGSATPELHGGSPYVDYRLHVSDTLLRADGSEIPGGAVLGVSSEWAPREKVAYTDTATGRVIRQRSGIAVGIQPGFEIQCFTLEGKRLLESRWGIDEWMHEGPLERTLLKPRSDLDPLERMEGSWYVQGDDGYGWWEGDSGECEVVEAVPLPEFAS